MFACNQTHFTSLQTRANALTAELLLLYGIRIITKPDVFKFDGTLQVYMRLRTRHSDPLVFEVASPTFGPLVTSLGESVEKNTAQEEELGRIKKLCRSRTGL